MIVVDTGPLWSFAVVDRLDLLGVRMTGRAAWTTAVREEVRRNTAANPFLEDVLDLSWLPEPVDLAEIGLAKSAFNLRQRLASAGDHPLEHLGEAESIVYAKHLGAASFLTADLDASRRAKFEGVHVIWTTTVLGELVADGDLREADGWDLCQRLQRLGRLPLHLTRQSVFG
jgi:predicted nucleic acid-binding protein